MGDMIVVGDTRMTETAADDEHDQLSDTELSRERFDWMETAPSTAIIETIAAVRGVDPTDFGPLYDTVDMDAIDTLFRSNPQTTELRVSFTHAELVVSLVADGTITITRRAGMAANGTDSGSQVIIDS